MSSIPERRQEKRLEIDSRRARRRASDRWEEELCSQLPLTSTPKAQSE